MGDERADQGSTAGDDGSELERVKAERDELAHEVEAYFVGEARRAAAGLNEREHRLWYKT